MLDFAKLSEILRLKVKRSASTGNRTTKSGSVRGPTFFKIKTSTFNMFICRSIWHYRHLAPDLAADLAFWQLDGRFFTTTPIIISSKIKLRWSYGINSTINTAYFVVSFE